MCQDLDLYSAFIPSENEYIIVHAAFLGSALQKARRITRLIFHSTEPVWLKQIHNPSLEQIALADQMSVLLGEPVPERKPKFDPELFWANLSNEIQELGL